MATDRMDLAVQSIRSDAPHAALRKAAIAACIAPAIVVLLFVARFATPVPVDDIWNQIQVLEGGVYGHSVMNWLFSPHNEHRIPITRAVLFGLDHLTGLDTRAEAVISYGVLLGALWVLWVAFRRRIKDAAMAPVLFIPVPFVLLTLRAQENLLKGFQICVHLCVLASVGSWLLLGDGRVPGRRLAASIALGLAAMLSFGSGLLVAPVGLVQLLWHWLRTREERFPWRGALLWTLVFTLALAAYRIDYHPSAFYQRPASSFKDAAAVALYAGTLLGAPFASTVSSALAVSAIVLAFIIVAVFAELRTGDGCGIEISLIAFAIANALAIAKSRAGYGPEHALHSRYVTLTALGVIGAWMAVARAALRERRMRAVGLAMVALLAGGAVSGWLIGFRDARAFAARVREHAATFANLGLNPDEPLKRVFGNDVLAPKLWINFMRCRGLSLYKGMPPEPMSFGNGEFHLDPVGEGPPSDAMAIPSSGALVISGWTYDALALKPARGVVARIDDRIEVPLQYGGDRQEAANRAADGRLVPVGFAGRLSAQALGRGEHRVRFRVFGVDDCLVYEPAPVLTFTVQG